MMFSSGPHNNNLIREPKQRVTKKRCIDEGWSIKFSSATISHHLTFHIIWFDIMEPVALSSVQCLFQFEIHCLPDFTLICKCHLSRNDGNNLQWCKKKDIKKKAGENKMRGGSGANMANSVNHVFLCLGLLVFKDELEGCVYGLRKRP